MTVYSYEEVYNDPAKGIIRSKEDTNIEGKRNGRNVTLVCDRKWGDISPDSIDIIFGLRLDPTGSLEQSRVWIPQDIPAGDFWWAGITSSTDRTKLESFGTTIVEPLSNRQQRWYGDIGTIRYEPSKFNYEVIALYTDSNATVEVQPPPDVYVSTTKSQYYDVLGIWGTTKFTGPFYFWKCRIRKIS